jgi:hypothetical protein
MTDEAAARSAHMTVSPAPSDDEVAAIIAAAEALWPKPVPAPSGWSPRNTSWRFSNRWWARPLPARRDRPWR